MRYYVVRPTNALSVAACIEHKFGVLLSPLSVRDGKLIDMSQWVNPIPGLPYSLDNGAWACHQAGVEWEPGPLLRLVERLGLEHPGGYWREGLNDGWFVLPDIVGGGARSLKRSLDFFEEHRNGPIADQCASFMLAVQDGMTPEQIRPFAERYRVGVFVGGSFEWKWATVHDWAELGLDTGVRVHVGRVNSIKRSLLCRDLGITSIDGSSVTVYSKNAPKMALCHDGDDSQIVKPGRARDYLPERLRQRIAEIEPRARHAIARRRFELTLGAAA